MRLQNLGTFLTNKTTKRKRGQRQKRRRKEKTFSHLKYIYKIPHQCGVHRKPRLLNTTQIRRDGFVVVVVVCLFVCFMGLLLLFVCFCLLLLLLFFSQPTRIQSVEMHIHILNMTSLVTLNIGQGIKSGIAR